MTNNYDLAPLEVAIVYQSRWQIEMFFKWIKQNLEIKRIWGHSENAVKTQLWVAINTYLIVAYLKRQVQSPYSIYEMSQIVGISIFSKTTINGVFTEKNINQNNQKRLNLCKKRIINVIVLTTNINFTKIGCLRCKQPNYLVSKVFML